MFNGSPGFVEMMFYQCEIHHLGNRCGRFTVSIFEGGSLSKSKIWRKLLMLSGSTLDTYQWQNLHSPAKNELFFLPAMI